MEKTIQLFNIQQSVFETIKTYKDLVITDSKSEKEVRGARASVKQLRYKIQNRQKELNKDLNEKKKKIKTGAENLILRIIPTENNLDIKIEEVEEIRAKIKAKKIAEEQAKKEAVAKLILAEEEAYLEEVKRQQAVQAAEIAAERAEIAAERAVVEAERLRIEAEEKVRQAAIAKAIADEKTKADEAARAEQKIIDDEAARLEAEKIRLADEVRQRELAESKAFAVDLANSIKDFEFDIPEFVHEEIVIKTIEFKRTINISINNQINAFCEKINKL